MKKLPDLDKGHPFYSKEALLWWKKHILELEKEERELSKKRRQPIEEISETSSD